LTALSVTAIFHEPAIAKRRIAQQPTRPTYFQDFAPPRNVDEARGSDAGIRKLTGQHLVLYTDLSSDPAIDVLTAVFDQAVLQWADYFGIDSATTRNWQAQGFLISDRRKFDALGLMPEDNDKFTHGISVGREFWLYDQPTAYYRRHLMLHEGTHVFMVSFLGGCGPGWFMEGTAELLSTHRYDDRYGRLTLRTMPQSRQEVPMLGRIKLIDDARTANRSLSLAAVIQIDNSKQLGTDAYAWCWAAAKFLDSHSRYRERFRQLRRYVREADFNEIFHHEFADDWDNLQVEWQAFIATLEHGYDFERMAVDFKNGQPLGRSPHSVTIEAGRGWQSSSVKLLAGKPYRITASGRYVIANDGQTWPCEPGGVTIDYHDGRPLGMLLGAIDGRADHTTLAHPFSIGLGTTFTPAVSGTLYLRVNDSSARLDDNRGKLIITVAEANKKIVTRAE
jgi:hypothetical protein